MGGDSGVLGWGLGVGNGIVSQFVDLSATVKELLKSDSICQSYVQIKKGPVFLTHSVVCRC